MWQDAPAHRTVASNRGLARCFDKDGARKVMAIVILRWAWRVARIRLCWCRSARRKHGWHWPAPPRFEDEEDYEEGDDDDDEEDEEDEEGDEEDGDEGDDAAAKPGKPLDNKNRNTKTSRLRNHLLTNDAITAAPPKKKQKVASVEDGEENGDDAEGDDDAEEDEEDAEDPEEPEELDGDAEAEANGDADDDLVKKASTKTYAPVVADGEDEVAAGGDEEE